MYTLAYDWQQLLERKKVRIQLGPRVLLLLAFEDKAYALADKCPHKGYPISTGHFEKGIIQCKEHGLEIDIRTGIAVDTQKSCTLIPNIQERGIKTYQTKIENGKVYVDLPVIK
ncbi:MAG: Rieske 2Fe-2S domain-containing protein [Firmicutes bacterium]|nr:Rieske 2Fe-2S domain-containing protein [Bacillota bacterium]